MLILYVAHSMSDHQIYKQIFQLDHLWMSWFFLFSLLNIYNRHVRCRHLHKEHMQTGFIWPWIRSIWGTFCSYHIRSSTEKVLWRSIHSFCCILYRNYRSGICSLYAIKVGLKFGRRAVWRNSQIHMNFLYFSSSQRRASLILAFFAWGAGCCYIGTKVDGDSWRVTGEIICGQFAQNRWIVQDIKKSLYLCY